MPSAENDQSNLRRPTIIDVAQAAGVSRQTVTRALNGLPDISQQTRTRVLDAAKKLNYRPNRAAQSLVGGRSVAIGFVVNDLRNPYYPELASSLVRLAAERDWSVIVCDLGRQPASGNLALESLVRRVDAVVGHLPHDRWIWDDLLASVPTVILDDAQFDENRARIEIDYAVGITEALDYLVASGRRNVAMIDAGGEPSRRRLIYRDYLRDHGLPWSNASEVSAQDTHQGGVDAARLLHEQYPAADAVLVFNDVMAVGALKGFARAGVRVPQDMAVIGIDGLDIGQLVTPELTSLALDKTEVAHVALELIEGILSGTLPLSGPHSQPRMTHTLVRRESA
ncbi:LacI family DNA-binding transcriptional regulator [Glaciihabitans sp. UYNi722]|uniref:LacI family DNA-binding transcriptional regulator n=1 Tax=Glaciihabitans sp. UYNi722 TaxID=3156344 RepID=UPI00339925F1